MDKEMVKESMNKWVENHMKVHSLMIKEKDLVFNVIQMVNYMKDNLEMIKEKGKVDINL